MTSLLINLTNKYFHIANGKKNTHKLKRQMIHSLKILQLKSQRVNIESFLEVKQKITNNPIEKWARNKSRQIILKRRKLSLKKDFLPHSL